MKLTALLVMLAGLGWGGEAYNRGDSVIVTDTLTFTPMVLGGELVKPGDCLTVDQDYILIRCPDFPPRILPENPTWDFKPDTLKAR